MGICLENTVKDYLSKLSAREPVPGGGSASAFAAALGAGLNLMVLNYSIPAGGQEDAKTKGLKDARLRQEDSMRKLSALIDEDCRVFRALMEALSAKRDAQKEYRRAAEVPLKICRECCTSADITAYLVENANKKLLTDVCGAAYILKAAFLAARLNVEVNLKHIEDDLFISDTHKELKACEEKINRAKKQTGNTYGRTD
ncbi:MAG: cyclodeaminase/cyclohydrolase family protein [Candidatus Omnitrophota bacterium]